MEADTEPVRNMLADTLDCFIGVTEGVLEVRNDNVGKFFQCFLF